MTATPTETTTRRYAVHGSTVEVRCDVPVLAADAHALLAPFAVDALPAGFQPATGSVELYDVAAVQRCLSAAAVRLPAPGQAGELYADGERFWLVDERWGLCEVNLLRGRWRSWVLPQPTTDAATVAEAAVLWPLAQVLRSRGLHLLPAVSIVRDGWAGLILCPFSVGPELSVLVDAGYRVIGQRWTAVREEEGRIALLHLPGWIEQTAGPRLRYLNAEQPETPDRIEVAAADLAHHAFCDAVLIAEPGRRPAAHARELPTATAANVLRKAWPMADLQPDRRANQLAPKLAKRCACVELQLSRDARGLLRLLDGVRPRAPVELKPAAPSPALSLRNRSPLRQAG